jgi:hypothetical protein
MKLTYLRDKCLGTSINQYALDRVDILSPYLSSNFFDKLKKINPNNVFITTDAGCSSSVLESVIQKLGVKLVMELCMQNATCFIGNTKQQIGLEDYCYGVHVTQLMVVLIEMQKYLVGYFFPI